MRGWEVVDERTLSLVTTNYVEMTAFVRKILDLASENLQNASQESLKPYYISAEQYLYTKKVLCDRAVNNMSLIRDGFLNVTPIVNYLASPGRRYDMTYVSPSVILVTDSASSYMSKFELRRQQYCDQVEAIRNMVKRLYLEKFLNLTEFEISRLALEKAARSYNYYRYVFFDKVVRKTDEVADKLIEVFLDANRTMMTSFKNAERSLIALEHLIEDMNKSWASIILLGDKTDRYLRKEMNKTELADYVFSEKILEAKRLLKSYFGQIQIASVTIDEELQVKKRSIQKLWRVMIGEESTKKFYAKIHEDVSMARTNKSVLDALAKTFAYMTKKDKQWIKQNTDRLSVYMNADFPQLNSEQMMEETNRIFSNFSQMLDLYMIMGGSQEELFHRVADLENVLLSFVEENKLNSVFFE